MGPINKLDGLVHSPWYLVTMGLWVEWVLSAGVTEEAKKKGWGEAGQKLKERAGLVRRAMTTKVGRNFEGSSVRGWGGGRSKGRVDVLSSLEAHR